MSYAVQFWGVRGKVVLAVNEGILIKWSRSTWMMGLFLGTKMVRSNGRSDLDSLLKIRGTIMIGREEGSEREHIILLEG